MYGLGKIVSLSLSKLSKTIYYLHGFGMKTGMKITFSSFSWRGVLGGLGVGGVASIDIVSISVSSGMCVHVGVLGAVGIPWEDGWDLSRGVEAELCRICFTPGDLSAYFLRLSNFVGALEFLGSISSDFPYK